MYKYTSPVPPLPNVVIPVTYASPSASKVIPVPTFNPLLAVTIPIESIFVTSSYVNVPPIDTLPLNVPLVAVSACVLTAPVIVDNPVILRFLPSISPPLNTPAVTIPVKLALLPPTLDEKAPSKVVAVIIPYAFIFLGVISPVVMLSLEVNATLPVRP